MSGGEDRTLVVRQEMHRDRWSALGAGTGIRSISGMPTAEELRRFELFAKYKDPFLSELAPDISIAVWEAGSVLFEEGSYIDLAFYIAEGEVELLLAGAAGAPSGDRPIFDAGRTKLDEEDADAGARATVFDLQATRQAARAATGAAAVTYLATMDFDFPLGARARLGAGELFGEIGALSGWPQSLTARTTAETTLVQIRLPALRQMRNRTKDLKERLDARYRERQLDAHLQATPLLRGVPAHAIRALAQEVELVSASRGDVLAAESAPVDSVWLVRSGFIRLSQEVEGRTRVVTYLSKGMTFGDTEFLLPAPREWSVTASSVEHAELVRMPFASLQRVLEAHPAVKERLWRSSVARVREIGASRRSVTRSEFLDAALEMGLAEGNSILVIDLERCTRCDDCVKGCADTHGGLPRFVREGDRYRNLLVAKSCYHCQDPVCLIGCPTGAIRRANVGDVVKIEADQCIGCRACANGCPYDAIVMHETGKTWPDDAVPARLRGQPRALASKCDLCYTSTAGPACVSNCPNACAYRIRSTEELQGLIRER